MKRRDFLKLIGIASIAPSALAVIPKKELTVAAAREFVDKMPEFKPNYAQNLILKARREGYTIGELGWVHIYTTAHYVK